MSFLINDSQSNNHENLVARINQLENEIFRLKENMHVENLRNRYLDINCASNYLGISPRSFYRIMERGELGYTMVGKHRKFLLTELDAYIQKQSTSALGSIL